MEIADAVGALVRLPAPPRRIVSLVPSLTETLFALGAGDRVAAVTRWCTDPPDAVGAVPKVGGTKNPDVAGIVGLAPDLVVMNAEENRAEDWGALRAAGLAVYVTDVRTVAAGIAVVATLGTLAGCAERGRAVAAALAAGVAAAARTAPAGAVRYFCPIWKNPWMTFNADTYAHDLLRLAGGVNVAAEHAERYPTLELAAVAARRPAVVLLPSEPYRFGERHVADVAPVGARAVRLVDGQALTWYGPRIASALRDFATLFTALDE